MASVEGLRAYLREEETADSEISSFLDAAVLYTTGAGVERPESDDSPLYDLLVYMIAAHWYDNRGLVYGGLQSGLQEIPMAATAIVHQLREGG